MSKDFKEFTETVLLVFGLICSVIMPAIGFVLWDWHLWLLRVFILGLFLLLTRSIVLYGKEWKSKTISDLENIYRSLGGR